MNLNSLASIQYVGMAEISRSCLNALARLIHFEDRISDVKLLTHENRHCFLILLNESELIAVKGGFSSGYIGEGSRSLSFALELIYSFGIDVNEYIVKQEIIKRIDASCLLKSDIDSLNSQNKSYTFNRFQYILQSDNREIWPSHKELKRIFPGEIPLGIIDDRIFDLAIQFKQNSDSAIMSGCRRLEDIIRDRTGLIHEHGERLFSRVFIKDDSLLCWKDLHPAENKGRATLFSATYMGYRNRRAHKESRNDVSNNIREFLLLNQLYCLEAVAVE